MIDISENISHRINESSVFFQGHIGQYLSKESANFQVTSNYGSVIDGSENVNYNKFKTMFASEINRRIGLRNRGGGKIDQISYDQIIIKKIKLVNDEKFEGYCGTFKLFPKTAICTKEGCNTFFEIGENRRCKHNDEAPFQQISFIAVCDICGRIAPLNYMTNIGHNCKKCKKENSLNILKWYRKDEMSSYSVKCTSCGEIESLFFYNCDHYKGKLSNNESKKFRGIPARSNAILQPCVITTPYIPEDWESETITSISFSKTFESLFTPGIDESLLTLSTFINSLDNHFWKLDEVVRFVRYQPDLEISDIQNWGNDKKIRVIKAIIVSAHNALSPDKSNMASIREYFGINLIEEELKKMRHITYSQHDRQGLLLSNIGEQIGSDNYFEKPRSMNVNNWEDYLNKYKLECIKVFQNVSMVQALIGTITGSARKINPLFNTIETGKEHEKKPTVFVRDFDTEVLFIKLRALEVSKWLESNGYDLSYDEKSCEDDLNSFLIDHEEAKNEVFTLLHTISHMVIQQAALTTGLDVQSLSEDIFPLSLGIIIYSTSSINIGGIETTYHSDIEGWIEKAIKLAHNCPQDPACMIDEIGACNACSYLPEFVCNFFNQNLDRSSIIGGDRYDKGYLEK